MTHEIQKGASPEKEPAEKTPRAAYIGPERQLTYPFPVWQAELMRRTGLPKDEFRELRDMHCREGEHWRRGSLNHIEFSLEGAEIMLRLVAPPCAPAGAGAAPNVSGEPAPAQDRRATATR